MSKVTNWLTPNFQSTHLSVCVVMVALLASGASADETTPQTSSSSLGVEPGLLQRFTASQAHMGVEFQAILYAKSEAEATGAFQAAFGRIVELDKILSDYDSSSEALRFAESAPHAEPIEVSSDLHFLLARAKDYQRVTHGAFDPTMGPLTKIWRRARRQNEVPSADVLAAARQSVGMNFVQLAASRRARLTHADMRLDFGGIAKGYAAEQALQAVRELGHSQALVRGSGDIAAGDAPPNSAGWVVGLAPLDPDEPITQTLTIANQCVSTSGDARQHLIVDGRRYSHIIDPRTGNPVEGRSSVTVVAPHGWQADGLATAFSVLGPEESLPIAASQEGIAALIVVECEGKQVRFPSKNWPVNEGR